jgi:cbb3-type cytochrome oxidase subunit 3
LHSNASPFFKLKTEKDAARRKGEADKKASNNLKRNQQYIPVQDREATRGIECASSAGILFIFLLFISVISLLNSNLNSLTAQQSSRLLEPSARAALLRRVTMATTTTTRSLAPPPTNAS